MAKRAPIVRINKWLPQQAMKLEQGAVAYSAEDKSGVYIEDFREATSTPVYLNARDWRAIGYHFFGIGDEPL